MGNNGVVATKAPTTAALRAGKGISKTLRKHLPKLPESNAETLARIIDAETGLPELLALVRSYRTSYPLDEYADVADEIIAKAEGRQP